MWVFTQDGFLSAVSDRHDATGQRLVVRARARRDIVAFASRVGVPWARTPAPADYRWRATVTREQFATYLAGEAYAIDYPNFKSMVRARLGAARESLYHSVWSTLLWGLQAPPRPPRALYDRHGGYMDLDDLDDLDPLPAVRGAGGRPPRPW